VCRLPDPTYFFIRLLEYLRIASDLKLPSDAQLIAQAWGSSSEPDPLPRETALSGRSVG
jgi:hypothetical protein